MKPKYRAYAHGELRTVTQLEWNGEGVKYVYVYPGIVRKYATRESRKINRLPINEVELMAWTGLKDKNGRDIYEGDHLNDGLRTFEVVWSPNMCWMYLQDTNSTKQASLAVKNAQKLEVIDTKYDQVEAA